MLIGGGETVQWMSTVVSSPTVQEIIHLPSLPVCHAVEMALILVWSLTMPDCIFLSTGFLDLSPNVTTGRTPKYQTAQFSHKYACAPNNFFY